MLLEAIIAILTAFSIAALMMVVAYINKQLSEYDAAEKDDE